MATNNTAIAPEGTKFFWADNSHISKQPLQSANSQAERARESAKLTLVLNATTGVAYTYQYAGVVEFGDPKSTSAANGWRRQFLIRNFQCQNGVGSRGGKQHWTVLEQDCIEELLEVMIRMIKTRLSADDWDIVTDVYNDLYEGGSIPAGTVYAPRKSNKNGQNVMLPKGSTKTETAVPERTTRAIRGMIANWPSVKQTMENLREARASDAQASNEDSDEDSDAASDSQGSDEEE